MRRWWVLVGGLSLVPVGVSAQTWTPGPEAYVVGNTVLAPPPAGWVAGGKGRGHGGGAPSPSPSPSPAVSPSSSSFSSGDPGRAESGFTFPARVQVEPAPVPVPLSGGPVWELPPFTGQLHVTPASGGAATLTIPLQVLFRLAAQPTVQAAPPPCPTGCVLPEPVVPSGLRQRLCNLAGQCVPWP